MELEYNEDMDEHYIVIPDSVLRRMNWEEGNLLDFDIDEEVLTVFKI